MKTLHILNKSPSHPFPASQCALFYSKHDAIILIEDAVYYTTLSAYQQFSNAPEFKAAGIVPTIYALKEDAEARGVISNNNTGIEYVTYEGFVELTASHDKSTTWY